MRLQVSPPDQSVLKSVVDWCVKNATATVEGWMVQHKDDGTHASVTADSVTTPILEGTTEDGLTLESTTLEIVLREPFTPGLSLSILSKNSDDVTLGRVSITPTGNASLPRGVTVHEYDNAQGSPQVRVGRDGSSVVAGALMLQQRTGTDTYLWFDNTGVLRSSTTAPSPGLGDTIGTPYGETGAWTPGFTFGGSSLSITYTNASGNYIKIGRLVYAQAAITLSSLGLSTGTVLLTGLPFVSANTTDAGALTVTAAVNMANLTSPPTGNVTANALTANLYDWGATGIALLDHTNFTNTTSITLTATYLAAS